MVVFFMLAGNDTAKISKKRLGGLVLFIFSYCCAPCHISFYKFGFSVKPLCVSSQIGKLRVRVVVQPNVILKSNCPYTHFYASRLRPPECQLHTIKRAILLTQFFKSNRGWGGRNFQSNGLYSNFNPNF